jgi:hypothetical protein
MHTGYRSHGARHATEYSPWSNANIIVCVSIESLEGLENVEAIAAEEVIAMIANGHSDLSARLGENPRYTKCGMIADGPRIFRGGWWILEKDGCKPDFEEFEREPGHPASGVLYQGHEAHRLDRMRADRDGARQGGRPTGAARHAPASPGPPDQSRRGD